MHRHDPRPDLPSRRARERLAGTLHREVAELQVRLSEASLRSDLYRAAGQPQAAADAVADQQELLDDFHARVDAAVSSAIVEREAEQIIAEELARHRQEGPAESRPPVALMAALAGLFLLAVMVVTEEPPGQLLRSSPPPGLDEPSASQMDATPLGLYAPADADAEGEIAHAEITPPDAGDSTQRPDDVAEIPPRTLDSLLALLQRDAEVVEELLAATLDLGVLDRAESTADREERPQEQGSDTTEDAGPETDDPSDSAGNGTAEEDDTATEEGEAPDSGDEEPVEGSVEDDVVIPDDDGVLGGESGSTALGTTFHEPEIG
ncbi:MAG: hypothetical protein R3343_12410 [Nitriliruptorales bacterium]|nr:hypothetical protein [Nitriliruptorales bacterium]